MRRPHVLMTADAVGGVLTYALELGGGLVAAGWRVTLALQRPATAEAEILAARRGIEPVRGDWPLDWLAPDAGAVLAAGRDLARLAERIGADLVHLNAPALAAGAAFAVPVIGACHSCLASWWRANRQGPLPEDFRWRTELLGRGYAACDLLLAPSFSFVQETLALYGQLPRGVRNGRRAETRRHEPARKRRQVLTAGRLWDEAKNALALDRAARRLDAEVLAAGSLTGPQGQTVALDAVRALGPLRADRLNEAMNESLIFASMARYEPFGLGVLEAAQSGCALVLSDIPTFRELWDGAALFVPLGEDDALAEALDRLLREPAAARELGVRAADRAWAYTAEAMTARTLDAYGAVLAAAAGEAAA